MIKENKKTGLKLHVQKTNVMASGPITSWQKVGEEVETVTDFIFFGSKITAYSEWVINLRTDYRFFY